MADEPKDWRDLCRAIISEQDTGKLLELVKELNQLLEKKPSESSEEDDDTQKDRAV